MDSAATAVATATDLPSQALETIYTCAASFFNPNGDDYATVLVRDFEQWARSYHPDDDDGIEYWVNVLFDIGCSEGTAWKALHWALVLSQDDSLFAAETDLAKLWSHVVKHNPYRGQRIETPRRRAPTKLVGRRNSGGVEQECAVCAHEIHATLAASVSRRIMPGQAPTRFDELLVDAVRRVVEDAENCLLDDEDVDDVVLKVRVLSEARAKLQQAESEVALEELILQAASHPAQAPPSLAMVCD